MERLNKHTRGTWISTGKSIYIENGRSIASATEMMAKNPIAQEHEYQIAVGNAALIAAAPELLAACECLVDRVLKGEIEVRWTCKDKICPNELANLGGMLDVIKKAKGEL